MTEIEQKLQEKQKQCAVYEQINYTLRKKLKGARKEIVILQDKVKELMSKP